MKNKLAKRLLLLLFLVATGLCIHAQSPSRHSAHLPDITVQSLPMTPDQAIPTENNFQQPALPNACKALQKDDEDLVTVTCVFICDQDNYKSTISKYTFFDAQGNRFVKYGFDDSPMELPKGRYDIVAEYHYIINPNHWKYVIQEQVDITNDTTITTNAEEAKVHIQFQPLLPNGEICRPETRLIHEDYSDEVIEPGNIGDLCYDVYLIDKNTGKTITGIGGNWANYWTGFIERDATHNSDIYVNKFSDRLAFTCSMIFAPQPQDGNFYQINFQAETCVDTLISNNPEDFLSIDVPFKQSVSGKANGETLEATVETLTYDAAQRPLSGWELIENFALQDLEACRYSVCNAFNTQAWTINTLNPSAVDGIDEWDWPLHLRDQSIINDRGTLRFMNNGLGSVKEPAFYLKPDNTEEFGVSYLPFYPGNPFYSYNIDQRMTVTGNSCPINISMPSLMMFDEDSGDINTWLFFSSYLGRNGELRERDRSLVHSTIKVDGETVIDTDGQGYYEWTKTAESQGIVDITVTNENVDVDGLQGKNVTVIHFDMAGDDNTAPTLQMLDFRDTEGNAIDRFAAANEGKLQFYCGDFNEQYIDDENHTQYFVCNDLAGVEVAYSPYQADTWTTLNASEVAEYYYDGMGHYYAAPLATVTGKGLEGWFDLKIKMTDAAGNWQEQVISPAFRIDELAYSGIATPRGSDNAHEMARYNLAGQRVGSDVKGVVIVRMSDGTARKVIN